MPILNMIAQGSGGGGGGSNVGEPTNLSASVTSNSSVDIKWTDNNLQALPPSTFQKSVLVRKVGSAPTTPSDGTTVVTETVMNTYQSSAYSDTGLTEGTTYYYQVFSYSTDGGITYGTPVSATPQSGWQPGANTIAYYPLDSTNTVNDLSGNGYDLTLTGTANFNTYQGVDCFNSQGTGYLTCSSLTDNYIGMVFTCSVWVYTTVPGTTSERGICGAVSSSSGYKGWDMKEHNFNGEVYQRETLGSSNIDIVAPTSFGSWHHVVGTYETGTNNQKIYVDGVLVSQTTNTRDITSSYLFVGARVWNSGGNIDSARNGGLSKLIIEDKTRTAQEIADYYNLTKANYGVS